MGGIVIKNVFTWDSFYYLVKVTVLKVPRQALSIAREEKRYHGLLQSTVGIMFMGTPHHGADGAKLASTAIKIANSIPTISLNVYQVKMLERGSEQLREISRSFGFIQNLKIVTVTESDTTYIPGLGQNLVGAYSTQLISVSTLTGQDCISGFSLPQPGRS